jgi:hypothetical protein
MYMQQKCMGVPCRAPWITGWSCPTILNIARWVELFRSGRESTADIHCSERSMSIHTDMSVAITEQCMDDYRHWTVNELTKHTQFLSLQISKFHDKTYNCTRLVWSGYYTSWMKCQKWMHYETCYINLEQFCHEGDSMLKRMIKINEIWGRAWLKCHHPTS